MITSLEENRVKFLGYELLAAPPRAYVDYQIFKHIWSWACRRHKNKSKKWIQERYMKMNQCLLRFYVGVLWRYKVEIGFVIFDNMTLLDFIGFYDPITRLKTMGFVTDIRWDICSFTQDVKDTTGIRIEPHKIREPLSQYDLIFIPGGFGTRSFMNDNDFIEWVKTAKHCNLKASVCTGSLIFGAAGFLENKTATTHPNAFEDLKKYCIVKDERIIDEGDVITARGVSSSIDLGLYICQKLCGEQVRKKIQSQMDYEGMPLYL